MASDLVAVENRLWAAADQLCANTTIKRAEVSARGERLRDDRRWQYGVPPAGNAWSDQGGAT